MAQVKGPLMSMSASGTIGETLVFGTWKGIQYVRQHAVPSNPNSAAQQAQRTKMSNSVDRWHEMEAAIKVAWATAATLAAGALSGFNLFTRIAVAQAAETVPILIDSVTDASASDIVDLSFTGIDQTDGTALAGANLELHYGRTTKLLETPEAITDATGGAYYVAAEGVGTGDWYWRVYDADAGRYITGFHVANSD